MARTLSVLVLVFLTAIIPFVPASEPRADRIGDAFPEHAVVRLGSACGRAEHPLKFLAFRPDGKTLVGLDEEYRLCLWDATTGLRVDDYPDREQRARMKELERVLPPPVATLSPDGKVLVLFEYGVRECYDVETGKRLGELPEQKLRDGQTPALVLPDNKSFVTVEDGRLRRWKLAGQPMGPPLGRAFDGVQFERLLAVNDGKRVLAVGVTEGHGCVHEFDLEKGGARREVTRFRLEVNALQERFLAAAGTRVVIVDYAVGKLQGWEVPSGKPAFAADLPRHAPGRATVTPNGKQVIGLFGTHLVVWDAATGKVTHELNRPEKAPEWEGDKVGGLLCVSHDGKRVAAVRPGGTAFQVLEVATGKPVFGTDGHSGKLFWVRALPGGKEFVTHAEDGALRWWDAKTGATTRQVTLKADSDAFALSPDGKTLALGANQKTLLVEAASGKTVRELRTGDLVGPLAFSPDGKSLAVASRDGECGPRVYSVGTGELLRELHLPVLHDERNWYVRHQWVSFSPDGRWLVAQTNKTGVVYWDLSTGAGRALGQGAPRHVEGAAFSPDGRTLALSTHGDEMTFWETATGKRRAILPDADRSNRLKDLEDLKKRSGPTHDDTAACRVAFSPDGWTLAGCSREGHVVLWDLRTAHVRQTLRAHQGPVLGVAFSPDGKQLISGGADTSAVVWDMTTALKPRAAQEEALEPDVLAGAWENLADRDGEAAYKLVRLLVRHAGQSVPELAKRLEPAQAPAEGDLKRWLGELDSDEFAVRQAARERLEKQGDLAAPALREAMKNSRSAEVRKVAEELLESSAGRELMGDRLRQVRGVEVLEKAGTPEAAQLLKRLAKGAPAALVTSEARDALRRLGQGD